MHKLKLLPLLLVIILALPLVAQDDDAEMALPEQVVVEVPGLLPEGIEWDDEGERFLLSSLSQGTIHQVSDDTGTTSPLIESDAFVSTVGIELDEANRRLLINNSDRQVFSGQEVTGMAELHVYDLERGEQIFAVDLTTLDAPEGTRYFANDVTVDDEGNAYVTNSFAPVIYQVDPEGNASVFIEDERLIGGFVGLNGIDFHPDGYLLAAVSGTGSIYKIPVDDPEAITEVELSEPLGIDGMYVHPNGTLVAIAQTGSGDDQVQEAVAVQSEDDWETATVVDRAETGGAATTITVRDGVPYYINAYLNNPDAESYEIVRVDFDSELMAMAGETEDVETFEDPDYNY